MFIGTSHSLSEPQAFEDGVDVLQVEGRVEAALELVRREPRRHAGIGREELEERLALFPGAHGVTLHDLVGDLARAPEEWLISRSCHRATFSRAASALVRTRRARPQMRSASSGLRLCGMAL